MSAVCVVAREGRDLSVMMPESMTVRDMEALGAAVLKAISTRGASVFAALQMVDKTEEKNREEPRGFRN